ncbi:MAG: nuclear transport factor 2 family protein [Acidimicrobiia bacterium]|nr:nuclear transport factor 2 family protein [Acidimicrobiia bacterium]
MTSEGSEDSTDEEVSAANAAFYEALEGGDLEGMVSVWSHTDDVQCAHPGRPPLRGWPDVLSSWQMIFASSGFPQVILTDEFVTRRQGIAWVTCTENMLSRGQTATAAALNVFELIDGRWRMVAHHAGPLMTA